MDSGSKGERIPKYMEKGESAMKKFATFLALLLVVLSVAVCYADGAETASLKPADWPKAPISMLVGSAAGGGTDIMARALAERRKRLRISSRPASWRSRKTYPNGRRRTSTSPTNRLRRCSPPATDGTANATGRSSPCCSTAGCACRSYAA